MVRLTRADIAALRRRCPGGVRENVDLAAISQWRIGGLADVVIRPSSVAELAMLRRWLHTQGMPHVVIGLTSNLLFSDEGLRVPCIQIGSRMSAVEIEGTDVHAQAGAWVPTLARRVMQAELTGAEHICGIPGALGGLICMNGGSQRKSIGSNIVDVEYVDSAGEILSRTAATCYFAYRQSVFQTTGDVIVSARLRFSPGDARAIRASMCAILAQRRRKFPRKQPNCGSVFKSFPEMYESVGPPGEVIERLGMKGQCIGGASIAEQHGNFITNTGTAKAKDVLRLVRCVAERVKTETGFSLTSEVTYVDAVGRMSPVYDSTEE